MTKILILYLDALVTFVGNTKFLGNFFIISNDGGQFLFDLNLGRRQVNINGGEFIDAGTSFFIELLSLSLSTKSLQNKNYVK